VVSGFVLATGAESGDAVAQITATLLAELPSVDFSDVRLDSFSATDAQLESLGVTREEAAVRFRDHVRQQVLDRLSEIFRFPLLPAAIEREFAPIWKAAESQMEMAPDERPAKADELRAIAGRRLRLGYVVAELARRFGIESANGAEMESAVIDRLIAEARLLERAASDDDLRTLWDL
jgi:hypothetical protein